MSTYPVHVTGPHGSWNGEAIVAGTRQEAMDVARSRAEGLPRGTSFTVVDPGGVTVAEYSR